MAGAGLLLERKEADENFEEEVGAEEPFEKDENERRVLMAICV